MPLQYRHLSQQEKYKLGIATLFKNTILPRYANDGSIAKFIYVPIIFSRGDMYYDIANNKTIRNQNVQNQVETNFVVPQMTLTFSGLSPSPEGNRNQNQIVVDDIFTPGMYEIGVTLTIYSRRSTDAEMIIEQIVPRFRPKLAVTVNISTDPEIKQEVVLIYNDADPNLPEEWEKDEVDIIESTIEFTTKIALYKFPSIGDVAIPIDFDFELIAKRDAFSETILEAGE